MMLDDEGLREEIERYIKAGAGAAAAVERAAGIFAGRIRALDNDYMRERACDVLDACYRVVEALDDSPRQILQLSGPAIIAAHEIYPTDIFLLDRSLIPVSYTHLDVYKRQQLYVHTGRQLFRGRMRLAETPPQH